MKAVTACQSILGIDNTAYLLTFIGSTFWVFGLMFAAENKKLDFVATTQWRGIATIIINAILCRYYGDTWDFHASDRSKLHMRNMLSSIQGLSLSLGLKYLSEPIVHTISNSGPIIVYVMDYFRNGRKVGTRELWGIIISSIGIVVTVNASLILYWLGMQ
jgi:drug/metabolite transporter (DMT)-like permease